MYGTERNDAAHLNMKLKQKALRDLAVVALVVYVAVRGAFDSAGDQAVSYCRRQRRAHLGAKQHLPT